MTLFLPAFWLRGRRWRVRVRLLDRGAWRRCRDDYPEGTVWRLWLGRVLVVAMVGREG